MVFFLDQRNNNEEDDSDEEFTLKVRLFNTLH